MWILATEMFSNVSRCGAVAQPDTSPRSNRYELDEFADVAASAHAGRNTRPATSSAEKKSCVVPVAFCAPSTGNSFRPDESLAAMRALYRSTCANASRIRKPPRTYWSGANCEVRDASSALSAAAVVMVMVVGAAASSMATAAASSASNHARTIWRQIRPDNCGLPPWSHASREISTLPEIAAGVMVCEVAVNTPGVGSVFSTLAATRPDEVENFGSTNGVASAIVPLLMAFQIGYSNSCWSTYMSGRCLFGLRDATSVIAVANSTRRRSASANCLCIQFVARSSASA